MRKVNLFLKLCPSAEHLTLTRPSELYSSLQIRREKVSRYRKKLTMTVCVSPAWMVTHRVPRTDHVRVGSSTGCKRTQKIEIGSFSTQGWRTHMISPKKYRSSVAKSRLPCMDYAPWVKSDHHRHCDVDNNNNDSHHCRGRLIYTTTNVSQTAGKVNANTNPTQSHR